MQDEKELPLEEIERRLKRTIIQFRLAVMEHVNEATEKGDLELASRWLNLLNTMRNVIGKMED